jgi:hypothetical protein
MVMFLFFEIICWPLYLVLFGPPSAAGVRKDLPVPGHGQGQLSHVGRIRTWLVAGPWAVVYTDGDPRHGLCRLCVAVLLTATWARVVSV